MRWMLLAMLLLAGVLPARADLIEMADGRKYTGKAVARGERVIITTDDGGTLEAPLGSVVKITAASTVNPQSAANSEWKRISTRLAFAEDLPSVIAMHEGFLRKYPESLQAADVRLSLQKYKQLFAAGATRVKGQWMSKDDLEALRQRWRKEAQPAIDFYKAGQLKDALESVKAALAADDANADALGIGGLAAVRANKLAQGKGYFATLTRGIFPSVLAENNLGALYFQDKQHSTSVTHYLKALQIMPGNRLLLDNISDALANYKDDKALPAYKALRKLYEQSELKMESEMNKQQMRRWGSTWIKEQDFQRMLKLQANVKDRMSKLDIQYRQVKVQLATVESQIVSNQNDINAYQIGVSNAEASARITVQGQGRRIVDGSETGYAGYRTMSGTLLVGAMQRKAALEQQQQTLRATMQEFPVRAEKLKAALADVQPKYPGIHRLMELEEVDKPPPPAPVEIPESLPADSDK